MTSFKQSRELECKKIQSLASFYTDTRVEMRYLLFPLIITVQNYLNNQISSSLMVAPCEQEEQDVAH